ncbi:MAG: hypothetical protein WBN89_15260 [Prochlorococcaceae cyanobacterium]
MPSSCPALISLLNRSGRRQRHWWLNEGGYPQRIASLLAAPLRATGAPARRFHEFEQIFEPLPRLAFETLPEAAPQACYRYRLRLVRPETSLCCWRRYPAGIGWRRRCGPVPLSRFLDRFATSDGSAAFTLHPADPVG